MLCRAGSFLLQLPIKVTPKVLKPMHAAAGYGRGAGALSAPGRRGRGGPPARGRAPYVRPGYSPHGGTPGRGRGIKLTTNVWRRPAAPAAPAASAAPP